MEYNYYKILGISSKATRFEVKRAFREKAKLFHPDSMSNQRSKEAFQVINDAYRVLSDEHKRQEYDIKLGVLTASASKNKAKQPPQYKEKPERSRPTRDCTYYQSMRAPQFEPHPIIKYFFYFVGIVFSTTLLMSLVYHLQAGKWPYIMVIIAIPALIVLHDACLGILGFKPRFLSLFYKKVKKMFAINWD